MDTSFNAAGEPHPAWKGQFGFCSALGMGFRFLRQMDTERVFREAKILSGHKELDSFLSPEEGLTISVPSYNSRFLLLCDCVWTHFALNTTEHQSQIPGFVCTVTFDSVQHLVSNSLDSVFLFVVVLRACHFFERTNATKPEDDCFGSKHLKAPSPMNYWIHPASQPAFRFPSKHLSHLWLEPCCLDTVHAVVIGPYPNQ